MNALVVGAPALTALLIAAAGLAVQPAATPVDPQQRPVARTTNCTEGGCHAQETSYRFLHAPVAVGACEMCHTYDEPREHTFLLKHEGAAMCDFCHIGKSAPGDALRGRTGTASDLLGVTNGIPLLHIHEPVREGDCTSCHNPHGSDLRQLVRGESTGAMCRSCHDSVASHLHMHTPVAEGDCTSCHQPHSSIHANLLVQEGRDLCISCHSDVLPKMGGFTRGAGWDQISHMPPPTGPFSAALMATRSLRTANSGGAGADATRIHEPVLGECSQCHDPHGAAQPALLVQDVGRLCSSCHEDVAMRARSAPVQHSAVFNDAACLNCHTPHHSKLTHLMRAEPVLMCLDCHAEPVLRADGSKVAGLASLLENGQHLHGPLSEGRCDGCHEVHGAAHTALLSGHYSENLYQAYTPEAYELCFSCHSSDLARLPETTTATNFRDGTQNLHYIHITAQDDSGRSCRLCHAPHSGKTFPRLHTEIQYGQWTMPMRYEATESGGTCAAGCHRPRSYDRYQAVNNDDEPAR